MSHEVQLEAVKSHEPQVALHAVHVTALPGFESYFLAGQTVVHVPASALKVAPGMQEVQLAASPALHVMHDESHAMHVVLRAPPTYLPVGHDATHEPSS